MDGAGNFFHNFPRFVRLVFVFVFMLFLYLNNTKPDWIPAKRTALVGNFLGKQKITWKVWTRVARRGLCEIEIDQQQKKTLCIEIGIHFFFQAEISPKLSLNKEHLTSCQNLWLVLATFSLMCSSSVSFSRPAFSIQTQRHFPTNVWFQIQRYTYLS